jgi:DNA-binding transcriptional regulator YbjK
MIRVLIIAALVACAGVARAGEPIANFENQPVAGALSASQVRDAIVAATARIVAREGVAAVTHRRLAGEAEVSLSSTTWHFATKADILEAALRWTAEHEVARIAAIAERVAATRARLDLRQLDLA